MEKVIERLHLDFETNQQYVDQVFRLIHERGLIPYVIDTERNGDIVHIVKKAEGNSSASSLGNLNMDFHTEVPQEENNPDYTILTCINGQEGVFTDVVELDLILEDMNWDHINTLLSENVSMKPNHSFADRTPREIKLLYQDENRNFCVRGNLAHITPTSKEVEIALNEFKRVLNGSFRHTVEFLHKGQTVLLNNKRTMHNRRGALSNPERELRRIYLKKYSKY